MIAPLLAGLVALAAPPEGWVRVDEPSMATVLTVEVPAEHADAAETVHAVFRAVEATANEWREGSELARLNAEAGRSAVQLSPETCALLREGLELARLTDGAFDPTWAALWGLWEGAEAPGEPEIVRRAALVGHARVELGADCRARLPVAGMKVGLGGLAKGWALDRAAEALHAAGVHAFYLSAGGQVLVSGPREGRPWRIGVRDPRGPREDAFALVEATDVSVSTSGDYERYVVRDGVRHHHILDPRTGRPTTGLRSATVVARDASTADALSTALMVLGPAEGLAVVGRFPGVEAVVVDAHGGVHATPGIAGRLVVLHAPRP